MMSRRIGRAGLVALAAVAVTISLSGCARDTIVDYTADSVTVPAGETLIIDFGTINSSVGDGWVITQEPDPAVLGEGKMESDYQGDNGATGGGNTLRYRFPAQAAGTTTVNFEYQFRGDVPEEQSDQKTASVEVTVE